MMLITFPTEDRKKREQIGELFKKYFFISFICNWGSEHLKSEVRQ